MTKKIISFVVLGVFLSVGTSFANHGKKSDSLESMYFMKVHFLMENQAELGLTDDQMDQIKSIKFDVKRAKIDTNAKKDLAMVDVYQELHHDEPDLAKIEGAIDQKFGAKNALSKLAAKALLDTKGILTPEQRTKAKQLFVKQMSESSNCAYKH